MACLLSALLSAEPADAAAPRVQRAQLESGTAILRFSDAGDRAGVAARRVNLRASLEGLGLTPNFFDVLPMAAVSGSQSTLLAAARLPGVVAAHSDRTLSYELYQSTSLVFGGAQVPMAAAGFDGRGVNVAVVDSGVDGLHPDLSDHIVENFEVAGEAPNPVVQECFLPGNVCDTDENGHGTHVSGIAVGDGTASGGFHRGIAPGAGIVGFSVGVGPTILFAVTAYDHILAHPELNIVAVNNSFGPSGGARFDSADPINQGTKRLHDAGIVAVFSNGNSGRNTESDDPPGASDCSTEVVDGTRVATAGVCKSNGYSVAPWVMSAAAGRKDGAGPPATQHLSTYSAAGDPDPQIALSGETIDYSPTLTAPGTNVRSLRDPTGDAQTVAATGEPGAIPPPPGGETYESSYIPLSGTSMAAPHLTGAVAVVQSAARARLGRLLSPEEVEAVITSSAQKMTGIDAFWDYPCGLVLAGAFVGECGSVNAARGETGEVYERWLVGAGYLDVAAAVAKVQAIPVPAGAGSQAGAGDVAGGPPGRCVDRLRPRARLAKARVKGRGHRRRITGVASDRGCGVKGAGSTAGVRLAVGHGEGNGRCRFVTRRGRLRAMRSCRRRQYLPARGSAAWRLALRRLPAGHYLVWARATDAAGNTGTLEGPRHLRVRR